MKIQMLNKKEKKEFENELKETYGILLPRCQLIKAGKEKIRLFTGDFSEHELNILVRTVNIETIGIYFAKRENDGIRLNFDSCNIFKAEKNIIDIDRKEAEKWLSGDNIENRKNSKGYVLLKFGNLIVGCGKAIKQTIINFVPKERRTNIV